MKVKRIPGTAKGTERPLQCSEQGRLQAQQAAAGRSNDRTGNRDKLCAASRVMKTHTSFYGD